MLDNNSLQHIGQRPAVVPAVVPAPIHASHPYARNCSNSNNIQTARNLIFQAKSLLDVTNAEPLFYVGANGKLLCRCCVGSSGFNIPQNATRISTTNPNRRVLTDEWRNFKKSLRHHLNLSTHATNSMAYYQRQGLRPTYTRADTEAGLTLIRMVYENVKTQRSYASFSDSCAVRFLEGAPIGFQNHSPQFPPSIVDCSYEVLKKKMVAYYTTQTPFGTFLPFGISADKDRSKNRSRQLTGLRYPSLDTNYKLPFINTSYIGHPSCERYTGAYLSHKISDQLSSFGIQASQFSEGFTGSSYDGQYLNLKVNDHLKLAHGLNADNGTLEVWDGAHIIDLIYKKAVKSSPAIGTVMSVVHNVTAILKNDVYEKYLAKCRSMNITMKQPKTPKDLKFVKHGLDQMVDFAEMKPVIVETLREKSINGRPSSKSKAKCLAYLTQLLQPSFDLILAFVIDLVRFLASFSLQFQQKHLFVHEYYNLTQMLHQLLSNIALSEDISTMPVDQRFVFRNFCRIAQAGPTSISGPGYMLRRGGPRVTSFADCIRTAINRCKRFIRLLVVNSHWFWFNHNYWKSETKLLLPECAGLLNHLLSGFQQKTNFITGGKEMCVDCQQFIREKDQENHNPQCTSQIFLTVPSLLPAFRRRLTADLEPLKKLLPRRLRHHVTTTSIGQLKAQLDATKSAVEQMGKTPTADSVSKFLFVNRVHWDKCLQGVLLLFLKLLVVPCTEAFMETLGSIMERYHQRFRHQDPGLDDRRVQKEIFLKLNGPPLILCDPFIRKVLAKYRTTGHRTFAHEATTLARLPISSLNIQRIRREAHNDINRIACLDFS